MQFNYDDQIGGAQPNPADMHGGGGGGMAGGLAGGAIGGGMAGGMGHRIEGDNKDVSASHAMGGAHNQQFFGMPQHAQPPPVAQIASYRDADLTKCKIHRKEDIKAFCKNCLCSICFKCLLGEHRSHEVTMLDELQVDDLKDKVG